MEQLFSVKDIMERYQLKSRQAAVKRMKEMNVYLNTKPYLVPESAVVAWEKSHEKKSPERIRAEMRLRRNSYYGSTTNR